jgi:hypothetical protein
VPVFLLQCSIESFFENDDVALQLLGLRISPDVSPVLDQLAAVQITLSFFLVEFELKIEVNKLSQKIKL